MSLLDQNTPVEMLSYVLRHLLLVQVQEAGLNKEGLVCLREAIQLQDDVAIQDMIDAPIVARVEQFAHAPKTERGKGPQSRGKPSCLPASGVHAARLNQDVLEGRPFLDSAIIDSSLFVNRIHRLLKQKQDPRYSDSRHERSPR